MDSTLCNKRRITALSLRSESCVSWSASSWYHAFAEIRTGPVGVKSIRNRNTLTPPGMPLIYRMSRLGAAVRKLTRYAKEARFAWHIAATARDRLSLIAAVLVFHVPAIRNRRSDAPQRFRIKLTREHEIWLRPGRSGDIFIFFEVLLDQLYESPDPKSPSPTIIDAGANVGIATLFFHMRFPEARIVCIEPDPDNFELLRRNVASLPGVHVVNAALSDTSGTVGWQAGPAGYAGRIEHSATRKVRALTLADLLRDHGIEHVDILKVDVEGAENMVLQDAAVLQKVDCIMLELHTPHTLDDLRAWVGPSGFEVLPAGPQNFRAHAAVRR